MSAVRATNTMSAEPCALADVQAMQDVLYDILATGIDTDQNDVPSSEIERFLHEHARSPKSLAEFRAFFAEHGLSVRARPTHQPPALVLPPIERAEHAAPETLTVTIETDADSDVLEPDTAAHRVALGTSAGFGAAPHSRLGPSALWALIGGTTIALAVVLVLGYVTLAELRAELDHSVAHDQQNREAIQTLRERAARLESSATTTGELVERMDQKNDLLLQSLIATEHEHGSKKHR